MTEKTEIKVKSLVEALNLFQQDNIRASKGATNPFFKSKYADLDEIIASVNHGTKYGLSFTQTVDFESHVVADKIHTTQFVRTTIYHNSSDQCITSRCIIAVKGNKFDDSHAIGSAITYAKRYSLSAIYGLATDDDGNANSNAPKNLPQSGGWTEKKTKMLVSIQEAIDNEDYAKAKQFIHSSKAGDILEWFKLNKPSEYEELNQQVQSLIEVIEDAEHFGTSND